MPNTGVLFKPFALCGWSPSLVRHRGEKVPSLLPSQSAARQHLRQLRFYPCGTLAGSSLTTCPVVGPSFSQRTRELSPARSATPVSQGSWNSFSLRLYFRVSGQLEDRWGAYGHLRGYLALGVDQHRRRRAARTERAPRLKA